MKQLRLREVKWLATANCWFGGCNKTLEFTHGSAATAAVLKEEGLTIEMSNLVHAGISDTF